MRILIVLAVVCCLVSTAVDADSDTGCTSVARFDEVNSRIFVVCPTLIDMSDAEIAQVTVDVFAKLSVAPGEYFISFFANAELAGYKTDNRLADYVSSGEWAQAYLGEYYTHSHAITLWPANPDKRVVRRLPPP